MTSFADLPDAARADILTLARQDIAEFLPEKHTAADIAALARSARRNPDADEFGPVVALQVADALDHLAAQARRREAKAAGKVQLTLVASR